MNINKKVFRTIIAFLLLIPFRLPIGVLFIKATSWIAELAEGNINESILLSNVVVTKIIYNIALAAMLIYNTEMISRDIMKRNPRDPNGDDSGIYWWAVALIIFFIAYIIFDGINTYNLYLSLNA